MVGLSPEVVISLMESGMKQAEIARVPLEEASVA